MTADSMDLVNEEYEALKKLLEWFDGPRAPVHVHTLPSVFQLTDELVARLLQPAAQSPAYAEAVLAATRYLSNACNAREETALYLGRAKPDVEAAVRAAFEYSRMLGLFRAYFPPS